VSEGEGLLYAEWECGIGEELSAGVWECAECFQTNCGGELRDRLIKIDGYSFVRSSEYKSFYP